MHQPQGTVALLYPFYSNQKLGFYAWSIFLPHFLPLNWSSLIQFPFLYLLGVILALCSVCNKCLK